MFNMNGFNRFPVPVRRFPFSILVQGSSTGYCLFIFVLIKCKYKEDLFLFAKHWNSEKWVEANKIENFEKFGRIPQKFDQYVFDCLKIFRPCLVKLLPLNFIHTKNGRSSVYIFPCAFSVAHISLR